jgi:transposase
MQKTYIVRLTDDEQATCLDIIQKLKGSSQKVRRANILLKADADGPHWTDQDIADAFLCSRQCVENLRQRLVTEGFDIALNGKQREVPITLKRLDGRQEAEVIALRCSDPPEGRNIWTLRLLADKVVELDIAPKISRMTVWRTFKKKIMQRKVQHYVIPPDHNTEFVVAMENVLETYEQPRDPEVPVVAMDEQPVQLLKETRPPTAATKNHARQIDYEYERAGIVSLFMFTAPLEGWRRVSVRERRTQLDWAHEVQRLLEEDFPQAKKVILVCDNLNTHTRGAFYEVFPPEIARSLVTRLEFVYTPRHGSWLNVAENDLSALTIQCVRHRRFGTIEALRRAVESWMTERNEKKKGIQWQFTTENARKKLKALYPVIE